MDLGNDFVCTRIGLFSNATLTVFKFLAGVLGHSQAMLADSIHSLSDGFATVITYIAIKWAKKPEDEKHPYGHGNIEVIASWMVAVILLLTGGFLAYSAVHSIIHKHYARPSGIALFAAIVAILLKEVLYRYTIYVGRSLNSPALKANAYDHRSDAFSSVGSFIGIGGAMLGWKFLDPVAGIVISFFVVKMGVDIVVENNRIIMDAMPSEDVIDGIKNFIEKFPGIKGQSDMRIHPVGREYIIDVSVFVDRSLTVAEGHRIATSLKETVTKNHEMVRDMIIHVEPY